MLQLKTGSPLLFSGPGFFSWIIRLGNKLGMGLTGRASSISHIEMALWSSDFSPEFRLAFNLERDTWYSLKSTMSGNVRDVFGEFVDGVSITRLQSLVDANKGHVYGRDVIPCVSARNIEDLERFITEYYGKPYEKNYLELALAALDRTDILIEETTETRKTVFCSELFSLIWKMWGWVEGDANELAPADYATRSEFLKGRTLGPMRLIGGKV